MLEQQHLCMFLPRAALCGARNANEWLRVKWQMLCPKNYRKLAKLLRSLEVIQVLVPFCCWTHCRKIVFS